MRSEEEKLDKDLKRSLLLIYLLTAHPLTLSAPDTEGSHKQRSVRIESRAAAEYSRNMAEEKTPPVEEVKWWIDRGPAKQRQKAPEKESALGRGIIEKWTYELLKDYKQEQAVRNVVDINPRTLKELSVPAGEWEYISLGVGSYPANGLAKIKQALTLPTNARGLIIDAGYSVRVLITGEPIGERLIDMNFTEAPSLDYWVENELVEEMLFSNVDEALKKLRANLSNYIKPLKLN